MFKQFDRKKIQPYMDLVTRVDGLDMRSVDNKILQTMIGELFATHRGVCLDDGRKPFVRGRKLTSVADRYNNVKEMIYPPEDKARLYRGNLPNDPVFYGGFSPVGICNELDMSSGEIMQTIVCRKIEESRPKLYLVGELESLSNNGTSSFYIDSRSAYEGFMKSMNDYPEDMYKQIVLDRLLSKRFRERQKNMSDMRLTAYASYQIRKGLGFDGVTYPSVEMSGGWNILIEPTSFDKYYSVVSSTIVSVDHVGNGAYLIDKILESEGIGEDGTINWPN